MNPALFCSRDWKELPAPSSPRPRESAPVAEVERKAAEVFAQWQAGETDFPRRALAQEALRRSLVPASASSEASRLLLEALSGKETPPGLYGGPPAAEDASRLGNPPPLRQEGACLRPPSQQPAARRRPSGAVRRQANSPDGFAALIPYAAQLSRSDLIAATHRALSKEEIEEEEIWMFLDNYLDGLLARAPSKQERVDEAAGILEKLLWRALHVGRKKRDGLVLVTVLRSEFGRYLAAATAERIHVAMMREPLLFGPQEWEEWLYYLPSEATWGRCGDIFAPLAVYFLSRLADELRRRPLPDMSASWLSPLTSLEERKECSGIPPQMSLGGAARPRDKRAHTEYSGSCDSGDAPSPKRARSAV